MFGRKNHVYESFEELNLRMLINLMNTGFNYEEAYEGVLGKRPKIIRTLEEAKKDLQVATLVRKGSDYDDAYKSVFGEFPKENYNDAYKPAFEQDIKEDKEEKLETNKENIEKNTEQNELVEMVMKNTGLSRKTCEKYLKQNNFNIEITFKEIYEKIQSGKIEIAGSTSAGTIYGNVSNASTIYGMDKFNTPRGHGFAAERANHLHDKVSNADFFGKGKVNLVGEDIDPETGRIIKNGADRVVNNVNIQTKYCASGSKCISECFENGKLRYINPDGTPMQIEVPSDKYEAAVQAMENRIRKGEVPGVTDPSKAKDIVRKGHFTYEQAKNIAKFGTVESIKFDAVNGMIISTTAMGITSALTFATAIWNEEDFDIAIKNAAYSGLRVGGTTFATSILASQLSRAGLNSALVGSSEAIVSLMGPKASAMLVNAFRSGGNIYGAAAMKSAAKMLRGNAITGAVSVAVLSSLDIANIFRGRISGSQLFKNIANTASTVAGGTAGWVGGATAGAAIGSAIPIIGTAIGGVVGGVLGSFAGGAAAGKVSGAVLDEFIEDDANKMVRRIESVFTKLAEDYLLNKKEAEKIIDRLGDKLTGGLLKDMFASSDRDLFATNLLKPLVEDQVKNRQVIKMPSDAQMVNGLRLVLEELADSED